MREKNHTMVDYNLIQSLDISDKEIHEAMGGDGGRLLVDAMEDSASHKPGQILSGRVVDITGENVTVEVGLKSEGTVHVSEFGDTPPAPGDTVEVLLEDIESEGGLVELSKKKADRYRGWQQLLETKTEGDEVSGKVVRKIKGGLLVDIDILAFLPASQVDIRRPKDIGEFIGSEIEAKILKIDEDQRNVVISRRKLIEERREKAKESLMAEIAEGQTRTGVVKNIANFGAFIDLGGIDGLLHITDMSWGRVNHPSDVVELDQEIECKILNVDFEEEKIALGLKQNTTSPWENVEEKYPVGSQIQGEVVSLTNYGAFVKLEEGLEGLIHISEMSWTRRINHPKEKLSVGAETDVQVLDIDKEKQEISLGLKQTEANPWTQVKEKYPPGTMIKGMVRNLTNFGAFVEIEEGIDGLLHVSDLSWTRKIGHPSELLKKGEDVECVVLEVDEEKMRVSLGHKQLTEDPWLRQIPEHYLPGQIVKGEVTKITNFGVFVELESDLEGLLHVSELSEQKVDPKEIVDVGDEIEVKILRVDTEERKIGLSLKRAQWAAEDMDKSDKSAEPRRGGLDSNAGLFAGMDKKIMQTVRNTAPGTQEDESSETMKEAEEPRAEAGNDTDEGAADKDTPSDETETESAAGVKPPQDDTEESAEPDTGDDTRGSVDEEGAAGAAEENAGEKE